MESKERHLIRLYLILLTFFLFLSGCAHRIDPQTRLYDNWKVKLSTQETWKVEGKLAFISPDERQSANLNWQQQGDLNQLVLTTFLGIRILELAHDEHNAKLEFDNEMYQDASASRLLQQLTGFTIPIEDADNWLKGTVTNDTLRVDELGRAQIVTWQSKNGQKWEITYGDYQQYAGYWLPKKLTLKHKKIKLKIQLYRWHFN
ncbi:outer membrane lipoprotein LolB [Pseudoalteromonas sp. H105]|nr:outer membrane lipoprotein LolB [Pseudoalteromonas sp. H105]